jgi:protein-tyrosine kinase
MNQHSPLRAGGSLLERAAELYGFDRPSPAPRPEPEAAREPVVQPAPQAQAEPKPAAAAARPASPRRAGPRRGTIDREALAEAGYILPDAPVTGLAEEVRIIKRQLLLGAEGKAGLAADRRRNILVCSSRPDEGKTFFAINLALSLAGERDVEVLLVDADFAKPEILSILGLEGGAGLADALAEPAIDPESLVVATDVPGLSVLPAGRHLNDITELLASARTREVLERLTEGRPKRLLIFDSPPALMASPATVLATHAGQLVMVVRADRTTEADLREAVGLLSGCEHVSLVLNGAGFAATGRRFGSYYGYGQ